MGRNDEYSRDAFYEETYETDDISDEFETELDPEDWEALYSEEIYDGWVTFIEYINDNFLMVNSYCSYTNFVDLVLNPQNYHSLSPSDHAVQAWIYIKQVPIIKERITPENFYSWFDIYVKQ
jgi:hypothetical protein